MKPRFQISLMLAPAFMFGFSFGSSFFHPWLQVYFGFGCVTINPHWWQQRQAVRARAFNDEILRMNQAK